jgi:hypothetical protein
MLHLVMPGLVHPRLDGVAAREDVDGQNKPGHDDALILRAFRE